MKKKIYKRNRLTHIKIGSIIAVGLLFTVSCGSESTRTDELLSEQLAETQEQIEDLQQTIQDLQQNTENQSAEVEESQDETVLEEEQIENSDEQVEDSQDESEVDQIMREEMMLLKSYLWLENSEEVEELQKLLGVEADGWYGAVTREAHLTALEEKGFPAGGVPDEEPPPCPPQDPMPDSEAIPMASIVLDMDGDGNTESGQTYYNWDLEVFYAHVSGSEFGPYWVELDDIGAAPANQWKASFGTDINADNRSEFWVRQIPFGASTVGYRVLIFEDCELKIAYIPDSNELFIDGGTVGTSWRIACEVEDGAPVIVQYEIVVGAVEGEGSLTGMVYQLSSTGFTFVTVRNLETFEDPGGPYGTDCESWIHDPPPWIES